jgi:hypothetical protein
VALWHCRRALFLPFDYFWLEACFYQQKILSSVTLLVLLTHNNSNQHNRNTISVPHSPPLSSCLVFTHSWRLLKKKSVNWNKRLMTLIANIKMLDLKKGKIFVLSSLRAETISLRRKRDSIPSFNNDVNNNNNNTNSYKVKQLSSPINSTSLLSN